RQPMAAADLHVAIRPDVKPFERYGANKSPKITIVLASELFQSRRYMLALRLEQKRMLGRLQMNGIGLDREPLFHRRQRPVVVAVSAQGAAEGQRRGFHDGKAPGVVALGARVDVQHLSQRLNAPVAAACRFAAVEREYGIIVERMYALAVGRADVHRL